MEKEHGERELNDLKNDVSVKAMELSRLQTLNENFKTKLEELEAARFLTFIYIRLFLSSYLSISRDGTNCRPSVIPSRS